MTATRASPEILLAEAQTLQRDGRLDGAIAIYQQLMVRDPLNAFATHYLGMAEYQRIAHQMGLERIARSILLAPHEAAFFANRSNLAMEKADVPAARADAARAIALQSNLGEACVLLAQSLARNSQLEEATRWALRGVILSPSNLAHRLEHAKLISQTGGNESASESTRRVILGFLQLMCLAPDFAEAFSEAGRILGQRREFDVALRCLARAVAIQPVHAEAWSNLGIVLLESGFSAEGLKGFVKGYALNPTLSYAASGAGLCLLLLGRYLDGWNLYESRLRTDAIWPSKRESERYFFGPPIFDSPAPNLRSRTLVWAEQGVGDEVMFGGLLAEFRGLCGEMLLQVDRRLMGLFGRAFPGVRVYERGLEVPQDRYDEQVPMGSLGKWLRPTRESFAGKGARYLQAQQGLGAKLRGELGIQAGEMLIGLSWRSASRETGMVRSLALKDLVSALRGAPGVKFVSLQYGDVREEIAAVERALAVAVLSHPGVDNREDLEGLAGLIEGCDLVVSVGNTTAHLSGALGQKTWVLLPHVAGWRWLHEGSTCPWYQSVTLYRQLERDRWDSVLEALSRDLSVIPSVIQP